MGRNINKWILLFHVVFFACQIEANNGWSSDFYTPSEMACEKYPITLRCPIDDVIQIITAEYGRQNKFTCSASSEEMKNTNCALPEAKDIMEKKCNNQTQCTFTVSDSNFPDPCPGTHKYLKTTYKCVKYMFACPGSLIGIGAEKATQVAVQPQTGLWTKDPLSNPDHVFFVTSSGHVVHEYLNWDDFTAGSLSMTYNLPSNIEPGNMVVYDRNLYYVKANSQSIIRYSLMTQTRTREAILPGHHASIMVDENGLWATYTQNSGYITIIKLDKDTLSTTETWTTNCRTRDTLHKFIICGVLYIVNPTTGKIEYSYNTNLKKEKRGLSIPFDADRAPSFGFNSRRTNSRSRGRTFLRYNATSISYNPREQLLYLWDSKDANAVYYKMHFNGRDPTKVHVIKTTKFIPPTTTPTTTRRRTTKTTRRPSITNLVKTEIPEVLPPEVVRPPADYCSPTTRNNIVWPKTNAGDVATMRCLDGTGAVATWQCIREQSMREAAWHVAGPDLSKCITWASDIETKFDAGLTNGATAFSSLASQISENNQEITEKSIEVTTQLVEKLLKDQNLPSKDDAKIIVESVTTITSKLLKQEPLKKMDGTERTKTIDVLMNSVEKAAFLYADTVATKPADTRDKEPLIIANNEALIQVEVREKTSQSLTSNSMTSFPDEDTCKEYGKCSGDVIQVPDYEILNQKGEGPATVVFTLYQTLGDFLSYNDDVEPDDLTWQLDSKIISATFRSTKYETDLSKPVKIILKHKKASSLPHQCVYWDYSESTETGNWSGDGCHLVESNETHTRCECDHLTTFAVLVNHAGVEMSAYHDTALEIVTSIGISISILCLILCILTFSCFRNLYSDRNTIHKHLCICLLAAETIFLIGIKQTQNEIACAVIAGLLHYSFLAAFLWMALEGFQLYVMLVEVFEGNSRWKWYYLTGYGIPAIIVGVSAGIDHSGYGTDKVCWLQVESGFIWSFLAPITVVIIANLVFLSMTVYKMYVHTMAFSDSGKINSIKASVRGASVLLCLLGITWAFGILWISEEMTVLAYLFCIFNAFQGMFIFIFHCLLPRKVRQEYGRCFSRLPCCRNLSPDTYVSNSMTFSKQYTPGRFAGNGTTGGAAQQTSMGRQSQLRRMWNETVAPKTSESSPITSEVTVTNMAPNRDASRSANHRMTSHHGQSSNSPEQHNQARQQVSQRQGNDDVFLPSDFEARQDHDFETQILPNDHDGLLQSEEEEDEMQYDRLHHHRHPENYHRHTPPFHPEHYPQSMHYHGGLPSAPRHHHHHSSTAQSAHNHPLFVPTSHSQPRIRDLAEGSAVDSMRNPTYNRRHDGAHPYYWELDAPLAHHHMHQSSLEDNISSAKRDSGISMQHLPPNSMMHHLAAEMQRNSIRSSRDDVSNKAMPNQESQIPHALPRNVSYPIRSKDDEGAGHHRYSPSQRNDAAFSDGEGQPSSYEDNENVQRYKKSSTIGGPHCAIHNPAIIPLTGHQDIAPHRRRKSLSTDSDDPITSDCSPSSTGSFDKPPPRQYRHWTSQEDQAEV